MRASEMPTEAILEELRGCILDLDPLTALEVPRLMRRMLELHSELVVRVESLELEVQGPVATCSHLADSDRPSTGLSAEPCKLCGRYFVDD